MDAGPEPTYKENMRAPTPPWDYLFKNEAFWAQGIYIFFVLICWNSIGSLSQKFN